MMAHVDWGMFGLGLAVMGMFFSAAILWVGRAPRPKRKGSD